MNQPVNPADPAIPVEDNVTFHDLGISPAILAELDKHKFVVPTPIQKAAIPAGLRGDDVLGLAQTGTGKTLAFGIPLVQFLQKSYGRALILVPTRELAIQVDETMQKIAAPLGMTTAVIIGGASMKMQLVALQANARILIATPGRLLDHAEQGTTDLRDICVLVLDEADRMLDMGFIPQIEAILEHLPEERQTHLFSATMPAEVSNIVSRYMKDPVRIEVARSGTAAEKVIQELYVVHRGAKDRLLRKILEHFKGTVLVFARTKIGAYRAASTIRAMRHTVTEIHSNRTLPQRKEALEGFKTGRYRVLVATDIAARGIDVKGIELVINYDLPDDSESYIHRIGRTGRAGMDGHAISFASPDQEKMVRDIEKLMKMPLKLGEIPGFQNEPFDAPGSRSYDPTARPSHGSHRPSHGGGGGHRPQGGRPHNGPPRPHQGAPRPQGQSGPRPQSPGGQHRPQGPRPPRPGGDRPHRSGGHRRHGGPREHGGGQLRHLPGA